MCLNHVCRKLGLVACDISAFIILCSIVWLHGLPFHARGEGGPWLAASSGCGPAPGGGSFSSSALPRGLGGDTAGRSGASGGQPPLRSAGPTGSSINLVICFSRLLDCECEFESESVFVSDSEYGSISGRCTSRGGGPSCRAMVAGSGGCDAR